MKPDAKVSEVAEALGLHVQTVRAMARAGDFPNSYKSGLGRETSPIRIPWADVEAFRNKQPKVSR